ncbi:MAG: ACT domain-containing protein [Clostridia bacterium]|nr:ACT domain-containing protein [Clostridia bacterium]MBQ8332642.1 ACT domain-containing protein [Clostridia bacterium]MBQ8369496.1 ACT domain-containing protein [Clostridia bacterium]MBQ8511946.1 ACT domain-containing protein [Clostridia bacterium]
MPVQVMTRDDKAAAVYIKNPPDVPGLAYRIFAAITDGGADVDMILQTASYNRRADIVFTVPLASADRTEEILHDLLGEHAETEIVLERQCTKLCVTGDGLNGRAGSAADLFRCLWDAGIRLCGVTTSDVKMTLLVNSADADRAADAIVTRMFFEE